MNLVCLENSKTIRAYQKEVSCWMPSNLSDVAIDLGEKFRQIRISESVITGYSEIK